MIWCGFAVIHIVSPIYIVIGTHLCASINNIIIPNIGTLALVNIPFGMHLTHIVFVESSIMINVLLRMHLASHVLIGTLAMVYICFKTRLALTLAYILVKMRMSQEMVYILVRMCLAFYVHFGTLIMIYIFIRMCLALMFLSKPWIWLTFLSGFGPSCFS
jgi:hypothetical protein